MAKKKNRQKEFKRKQKLMIKVVSEEEIALTESLGYQPVFVERRKIQNFDEQNIAMMQYFYEYGVYPDVQEINSKLGTGTFDWNQDHALFREAMYTPNKQKRKNGGRPAVGRPALMGITKASLATCNGESSCKDGLDR